MSELENSKPWTFFYLSRIVLFPFERKRTENRLKFTDNETFWLQLHSKPRLFNNYCFHSIVVMVIVMEAAAKMAG